MFAVGFVDVFVYSVHEIFIRISTAESIEVLSCQTCIERC